MHQPPQPPSPPQAPHPPTHAPVDYGRIMGLLRQLISRTGPDGTIKRSDLELLASDDDAPVSLVYAAAGMHPGLRFVREHEIAFGICTGKCQMWGGFDLLDLLLERADARIGADKPSFDVVPQGCLNLCDHPPSAVVATPDGVAGLPRCTAADVDEAIGMILDGEGDDTA